MMRSLSLDRVFVERAVSGSKPLPKRPEGRLLLDALRPDDILLCPKLDRMFRSASDALEGSERFRKQGVSLHLLDLGGDITGNGIGRMFFALTAAFAEFERDHIAERITDVKENERRKRRFLGGARPFGYRVGVDGGLVEDAEEMRVIEKARRWKEDGLSLRKITGLVRAEGCQVSHVTLGRV